MLKVLAKGGAFGAAADAPGVQQGQLRLAAACALLKLLRVSQLQIEVHLMESPARWHALGMVMQDRDADVREAFALKLSKELGLSERQPSVKPSSSTRARASQHFRVRPVQTAGTGITRVLTLKRIILLHLSNCDVVLVRIVVPVLIRIEMTSIAGLASRTKRVPVGQPFIRKTKSI